MVEIENEDVVTTEGILPQWTLNVQRIENELPCWPLTATATMDSWA